MSSLNSSHTQAQNSLFLHAFNLLPQLGPARLIKLANYFENDFEAAYHSSEKKLLEAGLEADQVKNFIALKNSLELNLEADRLKTYQIKLLSFLDPEYPELLKEIPKFPPLLYYRGKLEAPDELCLAAVGTRKITTYGRSALPDILQPIIDLGVTIVSGLAYGVDALAHELCVKAGKRTVAILGGGLDDKSLYPQNHVLLAQQILENNGLLLSEYPIGTPSLRHHFISRNRIISGLSVGTLVVECSLESGSLITAKHALEQNRQVYAVPGPIYAPQSQGPNNLIKMGAKLVSRTEDILEDLNLKDLPAQTQNQAVFTASPQETAVLAHLDRQPTHFDQLLKLSGLSAAEAMSALTFLEMKGKIRNLGGQQYSLVR
jgi:DNA processing protein